MGPWFSALWVELFAMLLSVLSIFPWHLSFINWRLISLQAAVIMAEKTTPEEPRSDSADDQGIAVTANFLSFCSSDGPTLSWILYCLNTVDRLKCSPAGIWKLEMAKHCVETSLLCSVRSNLEYCFVIWSPYIKNGIEILEKVFHLFFFLYFIYLSTF